MPYELIKESSDKEIMRSIPSKDVGIQHISESSDVAETIREMNSDVVDKDKFSAIDMKTRLEAIEISSIIALDSLVSMKFLPNDVSFITRSKKRLAVSLQGKGREEIVEVSRGIAEQKRGSSMFDKIGSFFGGNRT